MNLESTKNVTPSAYCSELNVSSPVQVEILQTEILPKVLLVGPSVGGGGAERRFSNIATYLFRGTPDVAVLNLGETSDHLLLGKVINLGWSSRLSYFKAIWLLRRMINQKRYDVLMAFGLFPNVVSIIANLLSVGHTKIIINEITRPKMASKNGKRWRSLLYNSLRKLLYGRSSLITANSIDGLRETCELTGISVERGVRVVNVIDNERLAKISSVDVEISLPKEKYIICVGRLDFMKCINTVIDAFGALSKSNNYYLIIVGDGAARLALEEQVKAKNLQKRVIFTGWLENPIPVLKGASAFVLASEYEGYSNSVLEAMFCDVPVITSYCSSDAHEMCEQGAALGFKVGAVTQLSRQIAAVVNDETLSQKLVTRAREYCAPHAMENAIPIYEELIWQVAGRVVIKCEDAN